MKRVYPILMFEVIEDKDLFNRLYKITKLYKENKETNKDDNHYINKFCINQIITYINNLRKVMLESDDEDIAIKADNYISIYIKEENIKNNIINVVVYDAIKEKEYIHTNYEKKDGKIFPYIEI